MKKWLSPIKAIPILYSLYKEFREYKKGKRICANCFSWGVIGHRDSCPSVKECCNRAATQSIVITRVPSRVKTRIKEDDGLRIIDKIYTDATFGCVYFERRNNA